MHKTTFTLIATALFAASSVFGGDMACCAHKTGKMECSQIYAKLNLTPEQKTKLDPFQQACEKEGCTEGSMKKFMAEAKGVLTPEQYTQLETQCRQMEKHGAKAES